MNKSSELSLTEIIINKQIWSSNLNVPVEKSWPNHECPQCGRYYTFDAARKLSKEIDGWRMPTDQDWRKLENSLGSGPEENTLSNRIGAPKLKNISGFNKFPGERRGSLIINENTRATYWSIDTIIFENIVLAKCRSLNREGFKKDHIYNYWQNTADSIGLSLKLIKE